MTDSTFNPLNPNLWKQGLRHAAPTYSFTASTAEQARNWQQNLRAQFKQRLGNFPPEKSPLNPVILQVDEFPGYRRESLRFTSRAGLEVFAFFLSPSSAQEPLPTRLGAMGISGGGTNTLFLAALDERVRATVVSGYLNTFSDSVMSISHCIDNFVPGLVLDAEMSDLAGLIAPRALWCEHGNIDHIFPVAAFERALKNTRKVYEVLQVEEHCSGEVFEGGHEFHGMGAWMFLEKYLRD